MKASSIIIRAVYLCWLLGAAFFCDAQLNTTTRKKKASKTVEAAIQKNKRDTLAQGYFNLGESYYQSGDLLKSEEYYKKARNQYQQLKDADGIAKSSRALGMVQEDLKKNAEALDNYKTAKKSSEVAGDSAANELNENDIDRLKSPLSKSSQQKKIESNINIGFLKNDTNEIVTGFSRLADINLKTNNTELALGAFNQAYNFSRNIPEQAQRYNQSITDVYLHNKNFAKAIETKQQILKEPFVAQSTQLKAQEITSLADIYIRKKEDSTAIRLLNESYALSVANGHTLEAKACIEKLDSIFQSHGRQESSLGLYKNFLSQLPTIISRDSSLADNRVIAETETRIRELENEKQFKDALIRRKNVFSRWLIGSLIVMAVFIFAILYILRKLRIKNKRIALQSLRREMNPHFIFNSLNSINQFIATNNEIEANQYLTKFSTLMRRVMENSKEDFVLFTKELELLQNYLDLEKSRFPDKFSFEINMDDALLADENLYLPGMLVQPHLENAIWHGLRYADEKGHLLLSFTKISKGIEIIVEDNGIGIAESRKAKTENQKKHSGRGITNTMERIRILNELYHQDIACEVNDKLPPDHGVKVKIIAPLLKKPGHEN